MSVSERAPVCSVRLLSVSFPSSGEHVLKALDSVSLDVFEGESVGIVGESGSGKSILALSMLALVGPAAVTTGSVWFGDCDVFSASPEALRRVRGRVAGLVLQDPIASLNPVRTIRSQLTESARHAGLSRLAARTEIDAALRSVGLEPAAVLGRYPFELSGGMNQRVAIAMALVQHPHMLIADEPTTSLDASTQLGILALLQSIRDHRGMALVLISHDLSVVYQITQRIAVIYAGRLVELGLTEDVTRHPVHPYTQALVAAIPRLADERARLSTIPGQLKPVMGGDSGCPFRERCPAALPICGEAFPEAREVGPLHTVWCWARDPGP